jgi:hypothetical protein
MMAPAQPAYRLDQHVHPLSETCPTCDQPITNEKAKAVQARAAAMQKRLAAEAETRAAQKIAAEKAQIEEAAKTRIEQAEREKAEAIKKTNTEATAKIEAAKVEGRRLAETAAAQRVAVAEKAKADAEKARADAEAAAIQKVATAEKAKAEAEAVAARKVNAAEQAARAKQEETQKQIEAANAKVREIEAQRDAAVETRAREVREAMEKDKAEALAALNSANDEKLRKALGEVDSLKRQLEQRRADALGEGAHIQLLDALKAAFPGDNIRRIRPGASGADILHTVMDNGQECGTIIYESKNSTRWLDEYVKKLVRDQTAAHADHAILATLAFPANTSQVEIRNGVIVVNPARAVVLAQILRKHLLHVHTLRLSKSERQGKMAEVYDFLTSERYRLLTGRLDTESDALLKLQEDDKKYHDRHWQKEGHLIVSMQKVKAEIGLAIGLIIGGSPETELAE